MPQQTQFGQTDALALAVVDFLNGRSDADAFCTKITAERRFAPVTDLASIPPHDSLPSVDVFPDVESTTRKSGPVFESNCAVHVFIQRQTVNADVEAACALLAQLRSQIVEALKTRRFLLPNAVHPIAVGGMVMTHARSADRNPDNPAGLYNLARLLQAHVFESDTIVIFSVSA